MNNFLPFLSFFCGIKGLWRLSEEYFLLSVRHQPQNPLMLLGQYSDDELDEDSSEGPIGEDSEDSVVAHDEQGKVSSREERKYANGVISSAHMEGGDEANQNNSASENILQTSEECEHKESTAVYPVESSSKEMDELCQSTAPATFDAKIVGDVFLGWKVLLDEESNQYYYWNVSTGETSWEVPSVLFPKTDLGNDEKATYDIDLEDTRFKTYEYNANLNTKLEISNPGDTCDGPNDEYKMDMNKEASKYSALQEKRVHGDADPSDLENMSGQHDSLHDLSSPVGASMKQSGDDIPDHLRKSGEDAEKHGDVVSAVEIEMEADFSSNLVEHCKSLLHKLKTMQGSQKSSQGYDQISNYMVEVDIRLADIRSLACNGLSLLPFWVHSEKRLKLLQAAIDEISVLSNSLSSCEANALHTSHHETTDETEANENGKISIHHSCREFYAAEYARSPESRKDAHVEASNGVVTTNSGSNSYEEGEFVEHAAHEELSTKTVHPGEEVDMDVDMEVEDVPPCDSTIANSSLGQNCLAHEKDVAQVLPSNEGSSFMELASIVPPPPPDDDWVPPPPPDDEPIPPPPPDEPPEATFSHPSDLQSVQPFPYAVSYPVSGYGFYGQMDNATSNLYSHAGGQVAVSHQHLYYEAVANAYSSDPMEANIVNPGAYYGFQGGSEHYVPVSVAADSSLHPSGSINEALPGPSGSLGTHIEDSSVLPNQSKCDDVANVGPIGISLNFPAGQATLQDSSTVIATENIVVSSTSITAPSSSVATASGAPSKVYRNKKRTVAVGSTLRSNKKVSNMVDKWKAAKEELHAEEEEPASAYEKLEKKRTREIEEWRAKQIASGEAKDNANFQPLGGDWRDRVKRKKSEKLKEAEPGPTATDGAGENQQPDLNALSKGLPVGWQVYWDESSKQVYYGNVVTTETTWTRPTN
ncbi:unnamed protein product [Cuscuta europaea]|uniref:WW domain-containing protein n=1 Tax=Cuscuta europaea TaxID=41803 RepID=A0A9P1EID7_CUSEU|nr:unnamed protein product [Cuscuta europaea]